MPETNQMREPRADLQGLRLAELVGALSLAVDLGLGQPMEHLARSCLLACRLGERIGLDEDERAALYYVAMMGWVGCIADSYEAATWFGDDITYRAGVYDFDMKPLPFLGYLVRRSASDGSPVRRIRAGVATAVTRGHNVQDSLRSHCQVTANVAEQLGLGPEVCEPLHQIFARWDGKGMPSDVGGDQIALPVRLWHVADVAEVHHRRGGVPAATEVVRARSGTQFDPVIANDFCSVAKELFGALPDGSAWDELLEAEPALRPALHGAEIDRALEVIADYADLKSPYFRGHSRGVATLAAAAARHLNLERAEVLTLRRAAFVHDIGRVGIPNTIWDRPSPLTPSERERVRLLPYYTERILDRPAVLRELAQIAGLAYERLDGSGYHRGLPASAIPMPARILAAADTYHTMLEPRPDRAGLESDAAAEELHEQVRAGKLDAAAVDAVLKSAGHRRTRPPAGPAGLTSREVEVLALVARGASNRQVARMLNISPKTAANHIEHVYLKIGVSTRAAAALFAMRHGLLRCLDPIE